MAGYRWSNLPIWRRPAGLCSAKGLPARPSERSRDDPRPAGFAHKLLPVLNARFETFGDLVGGMHLAAWAVHEEVRDEFAERYGNPHVEVYVVGWSHERAKSEAYVVVSHDLYGEPWQRLEIDRFACAPAVAPSEETDIPAAAFDVVRRQRLECDEHGHCCVGGLVQLTQVTANAIHSAVVHRWPDRIGEPLGEAA